MQSRFRMHLSVIASLLLAAVAFPARAVDQSQQLPIRVEVDLQSVPVQVKDSHGNNVPALSAADFTLFENGKPQKIAFFDAGNDPASLVILVDSSATVSATGRLGSAQSIADQFMRIVPLNDEVFLMEFTDQIGPFQRLTSEQLNNPSSVTATPAAKGGSALYDAIAAAVCHLRASKNLLQAIVVITDGIDQHSRISLEQLIELLRSSRAELFMTALNTRSKFNFLGRTEPRLTLVSGHDIDNPAIVFERLMKESGVQSSLPSSERDLDEALLEVSNNLKAQYTLAYYPEQSSNKLRKIEVRVDRPGMRVFARRFVESDSNSSEVVHFEEGTCTVSPKFHPYPYESKLLADGMIYREDFTDPLSGWPNHKTSHYVSGGYELSNPTAESSRFTSPSTLRTLTSFRQNVIAAYGPWWRDFRASVNVNAVLGPVREQNPFQLPREDPIDVDFPYASRPAAGLVFRFNQDGYYSLLMNSAADKKNLSVKVVKREFQEDSYTEMDIVPWTKVSTAALAGPGTDLSVEAIRDQILIFVNGHEVTSAHDDTFDQGYVGFVVSGPGRATFRNLLVEPK
jgi:Ca-activated chloride channel homolog